MVSVYVNGFEVCIYMGQKNRKEWRLCNTTLNSFRVRYIFFNVARTSNENPPTKIEALIYFSSFYTFFQEGGGGIGAVHSLD